MVMLYLVHKCLKSTKYQSGSLLHFKHSFSEYLSTYSVPTMLDIWLFAGRQLYAFNSLVSSVIITQQKDVYLCISYLFLKGFITYHLDLKYHIWKLS